MGHWTWTVRGVFLPAPPRLLYCHLALQFCTALSVSSPLVPCTKGLGVTGVGKEVCVDFRDDGLMVGSYVAGIGCLAFIGLDEFGSGRASERIGSVPVCVCKVICTRRTYFYGRLASLQVSP